jgi:hypothetical protein
MDEPYLKPKVIYSGLSDPDSKLEELKEMGDYDPYAEQLWKMPLADKENIHFMIRMNFSAKGCFYYFVSKLVLEELKKTEHGIRIDMIFSVIPGKPLHFYNVVTKKNRNGESFSFEVYHQNAKGKVLDYRDWSPEELGGKKPRRELSLDLCDLPLAKPYRSKSFKCNELLRGASEEMLKVIFFFIFGRCSWRGLSSMSGRSILVSL